MIKINQYAYNCHREPNLIGAYSRDREQKSCVLEWEFTMVDAFIIVELILTYRFIVGNLKKLDFL
jgi:hypothetical protein